MPPTASTHSNRAHYPEFAKRFADQAKTHPPVTDCHVSLLYAEFGDTVDRMQISIEVDRQALHNCLKELQSLRYVSPREQDRYLDSLQQGIRNAAAEVFSEIKKEAIHVQLAVKD